MKKIKKYGGVIFMSIFSLFVGLGALLTSISTKEEAVVFEAETTISLSSVQETTTSTTTVGQSDIESYIAGKTAKGQLFYEYNLLVNRCYNWERDSYQNWYGEDEQGNLLSTIEAGDVLLPGSYTFKKGNAYLVDIAEPNLDSYNNTTKKFTEYDLEGDALFKDLYGVTNSFITTSLGCDANAYYQDEFTYTWDNPEICAAIDSAWMSKLDAIYSGLAFPNENYNKNLVFQIYGSPILIVPEEDTTITLDVSKATSYPGLELYINHAKILEQDYQAPVIGGTVNLSVNVDNQPSLEEILSHVKAIDETDGVVPITVTSSTYTPGEMKVGEYYINLSATDTAGNTGTETITLNRFDSTSPSIEGQDSYVLNYDHDITLQKILNNLTTSDNVDTNLPLEVVSDTFSGNEHVLGNYQVVVRTKDLSNNYSANKTVNLAIKNQGNSVITAPKEITVTISSPLTLEVLKERISVTDGYDGEVTNYTIEGFDEYTRTERSVGINTITISYTNSGGNTATASIQIKKVDDKAPGIYFDSGYFVMLAPGETFTIEQFKEQAAKVLKINVEDILDVQGEYDTSTEGQYIMTLSLADESVQEFTILVGDTNKAPTFTFKDIFTKLYWVVTWEAFVANILNFSGWNWLNWTLAVIAGLVVIAVIGGVIFQKKKKN